MIAEQRCVSGAGQASLFALSAENAMVQFMSRGAPRLMENMVHNLLSCDSCCLHCLSCSLK